MIKDFFIDDVDILESTSTTNSMGNHIDTYATASTVKGLIDLVRGGKEIVGAQYLQKATHYLFVDYDTSITDNNLVECNNKRYRVLNVDNPIQRDNHLEVLLEYVKVDDL